MRIPRSWNLPQWADPEKLEEDARDIQEEQKKARQGDDEEPAPDTQRDGGIHDEDEELLLRASGHKEF